MKTVASVPQFRTPLNAKPRANPANSRLTRGVLYTAINRLVVRHWFRSRGRLYVDRDFPPGGPNGHLIIGLDVPRQE